MRYFLFTMLFMTQLSSGAQQRIYLYNASEQVMIPGFDTVAPYMDYYPAAGQASNKTAVLICPGGGYTHLAFEKEGVVPAKFFNAKGIDAFVLRYRLNNNRQEGHRFPDQYNDVTRAMRIVRSMADSLGIDPLKTGVMGFSAGGHLASMLTTMLEDGEPGATDPLLRMATRPAFSILIYPVITMDTGFAHRGSRNMLLGPNPDYKRAMELATETRVTPATPPVFLVHADDDKVVPPMNSVAFYTALKRNKVPATMYLYDHGGHGFGTAPSDPLLGQWPALCLVWLRRLGF